MVSHTVDLPAEFRDATPIQKFHRYAIIPVEEDNADVYFGLLGEDGAIRYFKADPLKIGTLAAEFFHLAMHSQMVAAGQHLERVLLPFDTAFTFTAIPMGNETNGMLEFMFYTSGQAAFRTMLRPELAADFASQILHALSTMPNPPNVPKIQQMLSNVPGKPHTGDSTVMYFGQTYRADILQMLGVLTVRGNLLEQSLIHLLSNVMETSHERAKALFYSIVNARGRLALISNLLPTSGLNEGRSKSIQEQLDKVQKAFDRRNSLVHGEWEFKNDKFIVREPSPNRTFKSQDPIETYKSIEMVTQDYYNLTLSVRLIADSILAERTNDSNTALTAKDASPDKL